MVWPVDPLTTALVLVLLARLLWPPAGTLARSRLQSLTGQVELRDGQIDPTAGPAGDRLGGSAAPGGTSMQDPERRRALVFAGLAGSAVLGLFPSTVGGLTAVLASVACYLGLRSMSGAGGVGRTPGEQLIAAIRIPGVTQTKEAVADPRLPFAIDLLAVCLRSGMPTSSALRSVSSLGISAPAVPAAEGRALDVSMVFARVAAAVELGSEPGTAWADWIGHPIYGRVARALVVTGESGSAVAGRLEDVSQQLRAAAGQQAMIRSQRAGVALMAPLGLCFLPAFVCLGVLPVVVGIAGQVFG